MTIELTVGNTFFTSHYISQSKIDLAFVLPEFKKAIIKYKGEQFSGGISWHNTGEIKGVRLYEHEFKRLINNHSISIGDVIMLDVYPEIPRIAKFWEEIDYNTYNISVPNKIGISEGEYAELLKRKCKIGRLGEESVVYFERNKLKDIGKKELAKKVERVSKKDIGLGYDIVSFDEYENPIYIEVKTTIGSSFCFEITANEKKVCERIKDAYYVYFINNYNVDKGIDQKLNLTIISGKEFESKINLRPSCYWAKIQGDS